MRGRVEASLSGERVADGERFQWSVEGTWSIAIERGVYRVSDFSGWRGETPRAFVDGPGFMLPYLSPAEVTEDGAFVGLVDPASAAEAMRAQLPTVKAAQPVILDHILSSDGLNAIAGDHWQSERGLWRQLALDPGEQQKLVSRAPVPQLGGGMLDIVLEARRGDDVDCPRAAALRCATFTARAVPDPDQTAAIIAKMAAPVKASEMESTLDLVVEIGTFTPYAYTFERRNVIQVAGGTKSSDKSRRSYAYSYE